MLRFFISPHPTFGSYKKPKTWGVEESPYFWWWYALTLNTDYVRLCANTADGKRTRVSAAIRRTYTDFGDVRYEGDRYAAFAQWWRNRVNTTETRGEFLFAEPLANSFVQHVTDGDAASSALKDEAVLLISIPLDRQRQHIDRSIDRLLRKHLTTKKGRTVRDPKLSRARYHLSRSLVPSALKKSFAVYEARKALEAEGQRINNSKIAEMAQLTYKETPKADEVAYTEAERRRIISATVARHYRTATELIRSAAEGHFP